eukprot:TRINITY_DN17162_c0_g1_i1.p1 TRINITY_DN17162_c0_g1~~TRINITY_DN17162_c0_g1_i1.p1  ORF type:complete len:1413 (+),score=351.90 TRINITY_DN17162_c0_g1_i1:125-4363(+)
MGDVAQAPDTQAASPSVSPRSGGEDSAQPAPAAAAAVAPQEAEQIALELRQKSERHVSVHQRLEVEFPGEDAAVWRFEIPWAPFAHLLATQVQAAIPNIYSAVFTVGSYRWRLLFTVRPLPLSANGTSAFPEPPYLSVFLENTQVRSAANRSNWQCLTYFKFELLSATTGQPMEVMHDQYVFEARGDVDRGFHSFAALEALRAEGRALRDSPDAPGGKVFEVLVSVKDGQTARERELQRIHTGGTRAATGLTGLRNQGATCYLNSVLQFLFSLTAFRNAVHRLPGSLAEARDRKLQEERAQSPDTPPAAGAVTSDPRQNIPLQLARVFYRLAKLDEPVRTNGLTESFGWTRADAFEQHDVQEMMNVLIDNLESKMKGTADECTMQHLFRGKRRSYVRCHNIEFESSRTEAFYDLQLQVKGFPSLQESLRYELTTESMTGVNKYHAVDAARGIDTFEDATKGEEFMVFPPVLIVHLKRFELDLQTGQFAKVNDACEFPEELDLKPYLRHVSGPPPPREGPPPPIMSNCSDEEWDAHLAGAPDQLYKLVSVLVHSGSLHGGHYYAYCAPGDGAKWFRFDDVLVSPATSANAVDDNWGGRARSRFWVDYTHRCTSAYMLAYVRRDRLAEVCCAECSIPPALAAEFDAEEAEEAQRARAAREAHRHHHFAVLTEADMRVHVSSGGGQLSLLPDPRAAVPLPPILKVSRTDTWGDLLCAICRHLGRPEGDAELLRVWSTRHWIRPRSGGAAAPDLCISDCGINLQRPVPPSAATPLQSLFGVPQPAESLRWLAITNSSDSNPGVPLFVSEHSRPAPHYRACFVKEFLPGGQGALGRLVYRGWLFCDTHQSVAVLERRLRSQLEVPDGEQLRLYVEQPEELAVRGQPLLACVPAHSDRLADPDEGAVLVIQREPGLLRFGDAELRDAGQALAAAGVTSGSLLELCSAPGGAAVPAAAEGPLRLTVRRYGAADVAVEVASDTTVGGLAARAAAAFADEEGGTEPPGAAELAAAEDLLGALGVDSNNIAQNLQVVEQRIASMRMDGAAELGGQGVAAVEAAKRVLLHSAPQPRCAPFPDVLQFYQYLIGRVEMKFYELGSDGKRLGDGVTLTVQISWGHDEVARALGPTLPWWPSRLRLWLLNAQHGTRERQWWPPQLRGPRRGWQTLGELLRSRQGCEFGYDKLEVPLADLAARQEVVLPFLSSRVRQLARVAVLVPRDAKVAEVLAAVRAKLPQELDADDLPAEDTRLAVIVARAGRMEQVLDEEANFLDVYQDLHTGPPQAEIRVDECPKRFVGGVEPAGQMLVRCAHVQPGQFAYRVAFHGTPFLLWLCPQDTAESVLCEVRDKLGLREEQTRGWRLAALFGDGVDHYFTDPAQSVYEVLSASEQGSYKRGNRIPVLGIEHKAVRSTPEKAVRIHN